MRRTEKRLKEIVSEQTEGQLQYQFRSEKESKKLKANLKDLYKEMTNSMVSYLKDGRPEEALFEYDRDYNEDAVGTLSTRKQSQLEQLQMLAYKLEEKKLKLAKEEQSTQFLL